MCIFLCDYTDHSLSLSLPVKSFCVSLILQKLSQHFQLYKSNSVYFNTSTYYVSDVCTTCGRNGLFPVGNVIRINKPRSLCISMYISMCPRCSIEFSIRVYTNQEDIVYTTPLTHFQRYGVSVHVDIILISNQLSCI